MAGTVSTTVKNQMLETVRSTGVPAVQGTHVSLHTADPGATGASEVAGGSPAYARKTTTWTAPSGGDLDLSNSPVFDIPAGTTVTHFGVWNALTTGTFVAGGPLSAPEVFAAQGTYTLSDADITI